MIEIPLKQWLAEEAMREGRTPSAIYNRIVQGWYGRHGRPVKIRRVNARVAFVVLPEGGPPPRAPKPRATRDSPCKPPVAPG